MKSVLYTIVAAAVLVCTACSWFASENVEKPAQELIQDGVDAYDRGRYTEAIKNFEQLKDWYPFSKFAILAELKKTPLIKDSEEWKLLDPWIVDQEAFHQYPKMPNPIFLPVLPRENLAF